MPRGSERQRLLKDLRQQILVNGIADILFDSSSSSNDDSTSDLSDSDASSTESSDDDITPVELRAIIKQNRYLAPRAKVPKNKAYVKETLFELDDARFKQEARMTKDSFRRIVSLIEGHNVFHNNSARQQGNVELQLFAAVSRLRCSGNGAAVGRIARKLGISEDTLDTYTNRVVKALISLESTTVTWPNDAEKAQIKRRIQEFSGFLNCLGFVDGTLILLEWKPVHGGEDYFSRKHQYGIGAMIICDDEKRIRYCFARHCWSAHDSRVFSCSKFAKTPENFLPNGEYVLADRGYATTKYVVSSYKKPHVNFKRNKDFNYALSRIRIRVEHCIGLLKGRFQCLRKLRVQIRNAKDHKRAVFWIRACCVLYNLLLDDLFDPNEYVCDQANVDFGTNLETSVQGTTEGQQKREFIKSLVFQSLGIVVT